MTYEEKRSTLIQAICHYGQPMQMLVAIEEMSELTKEIVKHRRGEDNRRQVAEEIADVGIMLEQLELMFNCRELTQDIREEKLARLKKRLEEN